MVKLARTSMNALKLLECVLKNVLTHLVHTFVNVIINIMPKIPMARPANVSMRQNLGSSSPTNIT